MATSQTGRTAPWAKALGAVLLVLLAALIAGYSIGSSREADRKRSAFEATRTDAQRFADTVVAHHDAPPTDRQDMQTALESSTGKGNASLFSMQPAEGRTRVVMQLARPYQRSLALFGLPEALVDRCFTVIFEGDAGQHLSADITAHDSDERCSDIARLAP